MTPQLDIPATVTDLVARAVAASARPEHDRFLDVLAALRGVAGIDASRDPTFRWNEYEIRVGSTAGVQEETAALASVAGLALGAAPQVVGALPVSGGTSVLITRYGACAGERLLRADATSEPFGAAAGRRLRDDMQKLADHGLVHPYARGVAHWLVSSETGHLVLERWGVVRAGDEDDRAEMLASVDRVLARRTPRSSLREFLRELLDLGRAAAPTAAQLRAHYARDRAIAFAGPDLVRPAWAWAVGGAGDAFVEIGGDVIGVQISDDPRGWGASVEAAIARGTLAEVEAITGPLREVPRASGDFRAEESVMAFVEIDGRHYPVTVAHADGAVKRVLVHFETPPPRPPRV